MDCKKIEELILTDYFDEQLTEKQNMQIEKHLASCGNCKVLEHIVRKTVIEPFNNVEKAKPPEALWFKVKEQVEEEQEKRLTRPLANIIRKLNPFLYIYRPEFAIVAMVIVFVTLATIIKSQSEKQETANISPENQVECITHLIDMFNHDSISEDNGLGTSIEEYFL